MRIASLCSYDQHYTNLFTGTIYPTNILKLFFSYYIRILKKMQTVIFREFHEIYHTQLYLKVPLLHHNTTAT